MTRLSNADNPVNVERSRCKLMSKLMKKYQKVTDRCILVYIDNEAEKKLATFFTNDPTFYHFYSASALLAMQCAVLARPFLSVCLSVTFRYCVQTNEDTVVWFSASGRTILLVSEE